MDDLPFLSGKNLDLIMGIVDGYHKLVGIILLAVDQWSICVWEHKLSMMIIQAIG
jgi:hypothetical protein